MTFKRYSSTKTMLTHEWHIILVVLATMVGSAVNAETWTEEECMEKLSGPPDAGIWEEMELELAEDEDVVTMEDMQRMAAGCPRHETDYWQFVLKKHPECVSVSTGDGPHKRRKRSVTMTTPVDYEFSGIPEVCNVPKVPDCDPDAPYRTPDGSCNNLNSPQWGMAFTPMLRDEDNAYEDGIGSPRTNGTEGDLLLSARLVSNRLHKAGPEEEKEKDRSLMCMQFGQWLAHDLALTHPRKTPDGGNPACCGDEKDSPECFPIELEPEDPISNTDCMPFTRSEISNCTGPAQQTDSMTALIDASMVYGVTEGEMKSLRTMQDGKLRCYASDMLPDAPGDGSCILEGVKTTENYCFVAGDERVNEQSGLQAAHTIFVWEHNLIANKLSEINPHWDDERLFQEARKIVGAETQAISYNEWLPKLLPDAIMESYELKLQGAYTYDSTVNPSISNAFATAAMRMGHSLIPNKIGDCPVRADKGLVCNEEPLQNIFFRTNQLLSRQPGSVGGVLQWLARTRSLRSDNKIEPSAQQHLFQDQHGFGLDVGALNLQRGRDHGLLPYMAYRDLAGLPTAASFAELVDIPQKSINMLKDVYDDVADIDLFSGLLLENKMAGSMVGRLQGHMIASQFRRLRKGDRYFFQSTMSAGQQQQIQQRKMSRIMCDNIAGVVWTAEDVFNVPDKDSNPLVECASLPGLDLEQWREEPLAP